MLPALGKFLSPNGCVVHSELHSFQSAIFMAQLAIPSPLDGLNRFLLTRFP